MQSQYLPAPGITIQWAPEVYISPCFNHFRDDAALKCLTGTGIALHEKQADFDRLQRQADADKKAWEGRNKELEEQLAALTVRNAEAERMFKLKEDQLAKRLAGTQQLLGDLARDHEDLKDATQEQLAALRDKLAQVQKECKQLEAERAALLNQLKDAEVTAQARRDAEQRVTQLENAIAATQERARDMINSLTKQRDDAEAECNRLQGRLAGAHRALIDQEQQRKDAETAAKHLLVYNHQLTCSLNIEKLINEPLRHTNHASTTLSHVMRSFGAPMAADRSLVPVAQPLPPPLRSILHPAVSLACAQASPATAPPLPEASTTPFQQSIPLAQKRTPAAVYDGATASPLADLMSPHARPVQPSSAPNTPLPTPYHSPIHEAHENIRSVGRSTLTRLGRAWATTTETAGHPHAAFLDNPPRFQTLYTGAQQGAKAVRLRSAGPTARPRPHALSQPISPLALETFLLFSPGVSTFDGASQTGGDLGAHPPASVPDYRRPTPTLLRTYHDSRSAAAGTTSSPATPSPRRSRKTTASKPSPLVDRASHRSTAQHSRVGARPTLSPRHAPEEASRRSPGQYVVAKKPYAAAKHAPYGRVSTSSSSTDTIDSSEDSAVALASSHGTVDYQQD